MFTLVFEQVKKRLICDPQKSLRRLLALKNKSWYGFSFLEEENIDM
jgi:hypothetical protein